MLRLAKGCRGAEGKAYVTGSVLHMPQRVYDIYLYEGEFRRCVGMSFGVCNDKDCTLLQQGVSVYQYMV